MKILEAFNINKVYKTEATELRVLKGVDLSIDKGEFVSIVGPSGAGKSTLLHILSGLDAPTEGKVVIEGQDIYKWKDNDRAKMRNLKIGFVFQFYHLLPEFTVLENVVLPGMIKNNQSKTKYFEERGYALLSDLGLKDRAQHRPFQLSGGEQQRVAIARALFNEPSIIFCDEPTGNLDSESGKGIKDMLMQLNKKNGQTLVVVTHDLDFASYAGRKIVMRDGKLISSK
ncbi:MAG: ABC transporter ATP-binding protein [Candidatus Omnitrophica bacterium]|nr:ABC transporter ATP-binding protein [Candidatus Omnitrophota bacterium]